MSDVVPHVAVGRALSVHFVSDLPGLRAVGGASVGKIRLSTEPIGLVPLTLTNVVVGSRYRVERQSDGSLAEPTANAEGVAESSTVAISLNYYASGSANNDLRVKVRKASGSPTYKPFETFLIIGASAQSIFIGQIADE